MARQKKQRKERTVRDPRYESIYDVEYGFGKYMDCRQDEDLQQEPCRRAPMSRVEKVLARNKNKYV